MPLLLPVSIIFARNSGMKEQLNVKQNERLKVLLLSYSRSGSSLLGELLSLHPSTSYYFEPFWKYDLPCSQRHNSSSIVQFLEEILRKGLINSKMEMFWVFPSLMFIDIIINTLFTVVRTIWHAAHF